MDPNVYAAVKDYVVNKKFPECSSKVERRLREQKI